MYDDERQLTISEGDGVGEPASGPPAGASVPNGRDEGQDPDLALVLAAGRGDARAARSLVDRLLPPITGFSARMLGDAAEAEDVAQEVFIKAWGAAACWRPGGARFSTWLLRVARNACIDRLRRRPASLPETYDAVDESAGPAEQIEREQSRDAVRQAMGALPERQREALALCYYQGLPNRQAADIMDVSVEALESLLSRARRAMRRQMQEADHG